MLTHKFSNPIHSYHLESYCHTFISYVVTINILHYLYYIIYSLCCSSSYDISSLAPASRPVGQHPGQTRGNGFICLNYLIVKIFLLSLIFIIFHILNVRQQYLACSNHYPCLLLIVSLISSIIKERMKQKYG